MSCHATHFVPFHCIGDLLDGSVPKGKIEIACLLLVDDDQLLPIGGRKDFIESTTNADDGNEVEALSVTRDDALYESHPTDDGIHVEQHALSNSTRTPAITDVHILGVSVFDLKPTSSIFRNSPQVALMCDGWKNSTGIAKFAGSSANWVMKKSYLWQFKMKGVAFLKAVVTSGSTTLGSICISTRELIEVPKDAQGLITIVRAIELSQDGSTTAGMLRLNMNVRFRDFDDEEDNFDVADAADVAPSDDVLITRGADDALNQNNHHHQLNDLIDKSSGTIMRDATGSADIIVPSLMLKKSTEIGFPLTINIMRITCIDIRRTFSIIPSMMPICVIVQSRKWKKTTPGGVSSTSRSSCCEWSDLIEWQLNIPDESTSLTFITKVGLFEIGEISITGSELLSIPRTSQGFTEISRNIRKNGTVTGKLHICLILLPYISKTEKEKQVKRRDEGLQEVMMNVKSMGSMSISLISASDISPMYHLLHLSLTIGDFHQEDVRAYNKGGITIWGNLGWFDIPLLERSILTISLSTNGEVFGNMIATAADIVLAPVDSDGLTVIHADLLDGVTYKGQVRIACKIKLLLNNDDSSSNQQVISNSSRIDRNGRLVKQPVALALKAAWTDAIARVTVPSIALKDLKSVHKHGKNSPLVKMEIGGLRYQSNSKSYAGTKAEWSDLSWPVEMNPNHKVKFLATSGSVLIGATIIPVQKIVDQFKLNVNARDVVFHENLIKNDAIMGHISIIFRSETIHPEEGASSGHAMDHSASNVLYGVQSSVHTRQMMGAIDEDTRSTAEENVLDIERYNRNVDRFKSSNRSVYDDIKSLNSYLSYSASKDTSTWYMDDSTIMTHQSDYNSIDSSLSPKHSQSMEPSMVSSSYTRSSSTGNMNDNNDDESGDVTSRSYNNDESGDVTSRSYNNDDDSGDVTSRSYSSYESGDVTSRS